MAVSLDSIANLSPELQRAFVASVQAEKKPIQTMTANKTKIDSRVKLANEVIGKVDAIKALMPGLDTPYSLRELALNSSDANALSGTVDKKLASPGTHNLEVLQLATSASAVSNGFPDKNETSFGTGYFSFTTNDGDTKEFFLDDENSTLEGIAKVLNGARLGVKASVVNDQTDPENPFRLVLVADGTGSASTINYPEFYFIDGAEEFFIEEERPAQNAFIRYEGHEFQSPSNEVADLIPGVTINLKGLTDPGKPAALTVNQDIPKTTAKVKSLVDNINGVFSFIQQQNKIDEQTDTSQTLGGEYSLRVTEQRLRAALIQNRIFDETPTNVRSMSDLGIQFTKEGTLKFDDKKFEAAINADFDDVVHFLTGSEDRPGIFTGLGKTLFSITGPPGAVLTSFQMSVMEYSTRVSKDIEKREKLSDKKTEDLKMRMARMQSAITSMQRQGSSLAANGIQAGGLEAQLLGG